MALIQDLCHSYRISFLVIEEMLSAEERCLMVQEFNDPNSEICELSHFIMIIY
jgi:hypothetical protein